MDREYIENSIGSILEEYLENEDIYDVIKKVSNIDKELLSISLYFCLKAEVTNVMRKIIDKIDDKNEDVINILTQNGDVVNSLQKVLMLNNHLKE